MMTEGLFEFALGFLLGIVVLTSVYMFLSTVLQERVEQEIALWFERNGDKH